MLCAIYVRVSRVTKSNIGGSLADQLAECKAYAERQGWVVADVYEERGKSAYNEKRLDRRTEYLRMLTDAKAKRFNVVLVWKYDRFSRRMLTALSARHELELLGVTVVSATEPFDTKTAAGKFGARNMLNVAELFSDMLSERMKTARHSEATKGRHLGPSPAGYVPAGGGVLDVVPEQADMVRHLLTLYATGQYSARRVAVFLNERGYTMPNGRPLIPADVRRIAANAPIYAGKVRSGGVWIAGNHEPIIDGDLEARALAALARRSQQQDRRYARTQDSTALLAGLCYCEACRQSGRESKAWFLSTNMARSYRCRYRADGGNCAVSYIRAEPIEAHLLAILDTLSVVPDDWLSDAEALILEQLTTSPLPAIDPAVIQEKIRRLARLYANGLKSDADYQSELNALRAQLAAAPAPSLQPRLTTHEVMARMNDIPTLIRRGTVAERRQVISELIEQVYALPGEIAAIRPTTLYAPFLHSVIEFRSGYSAPVCRCHAIAHTGRP